MNRRRGVASIVGNLFTLIILFSLFASIFAFIQYQRSSMQVQSILLNKIDYDIITNIVRCNDTNNYCITIGIINKSTEKIDILSFWITDKYGIPILQRDINIMLEKGRSAVLLDSYSMSNVNNGDRIRIKIVTSDGTVKSEELIIPYPILKIKAIPIKSLRCVDQTILIHVINNEDAPIDNIKVYINNGRNNIAVLDVGRLDGKGDVILQYNILSATNNLTIYAEGMSILERSIRSNTEMVRLDCS
ncbi:hypothetical protein HRbin04_00449 [archaeon HR04]|nr:hypothetical protein HRbin04_00449 [archaeon HR04]